MTLAKSFRVQWLASAYAAIVSILLVFLLARLLGPETFGKYNYLLTVASLYAILQDGGFRTLIFRELTSPTFHKINNLVSLSQGHNILVTTIGILILIVMPLNNYLILMLAIISFGFATASKFFSSQLKGQGQFFQEAQWQITSKSLSVLGVLSFIFIFEPTIEIIFGGSIVGYFAAFFLRPRICKFNFFFKKLDTPIYKSLVSLLIIDIATLIYFKIDIVMLRHLGIDLESLGYYSAGSRLIEGLIFMHLPFATVLFREMRTRASYPKKFTPYVLKLFFLGSASPIIIAPICYIFSKEILYIFYGANFADSSSLFDILLISFFFMIPNLVLTQATLAIDREYFYAKITCIAALTNIGLNFYLIPAMGAKGAAIGTVATELTLMVLIGGGIISWHRKAIFEQ
jgi:O-antigen/teichoic acid export membrane protein